MRFISISFIITLFYVLLLLLLVAVAIVFVVEVVEVIMSSRTLVSNNEVV